MSNNASSKPTVLFVFTSAHRIANRPTGWSLPDAAKPFYALKSEYNIVAVSPQGGEPPLDPRTAKEFNDDECKKFINDPEALDVWQKTRRIRDVKVEDIHAICIVGGHGAMVDLAEDQELANLIYSLRKNDKVISAISHGPSGLLAVVKTGVDKNFLSNVRVTAITDQQEEQAGFQGLLPFSLERELQSAGAAYTAMDVSFDNGILTGMNSYCADQFASQLRMVLSKGQ
ncbi:hypothetical protein Q5752_006418 [Cryptotrichosporon argae]